MWINAYNNRSNPGILGGYIMESVQALGGAPPMMGGDLGTENVCVRDKRCFF